MKKLKKQSVFKSVVSAILIVIAYLIIAAIMIAAFSTIIRLIMWIWGAEL